MRKRYVLSLFFLSFIGLVVHFYAYFFVSTFTNWLLFFNVILFLSFILVLLYSLKSQPESTINPTESEAIFRNLFENGKILKVVLSRDLRIVFFNKAFSDTVKKELDLDVKVGDFYANKMLIDDYDLFKSRTNEAFEGKIVSFNRQVKNPIRGNEIWVEIEYTPLLIEKNKDINNIAINILNITQIKKNEKLVIEKNTFIEKINDVTPFIIHIYDLKLQKYVYVNRGIDDIVKFSKQEILASSQDMFNGIVPDEDVKNFFYSPEKLALLNEKNILEFEFRLQNNGKKTWLSSRETPFLKGENGNIIQILGLTRDVNSKKEKEKKLHNAFDELKKVNEELDSFVYKASHDLRSPLGAILALITLVKDQELEEASKPYIELMEQSVHKVIKVTDDLIDHTRVTKAELRIEKINIKNLIQGTINELRFLKNGDMIKFKVECIGEEYIATDLVRINMIVNNLIGNAIKYHRIKDNIPFIKVDIENTKQDLKLSFEDNGTGIDEIHQPKLFDMFFRATKESSGTGLGLYIVKSAVEKLSGKIELNSKLGVGTEFVVTLPHHSN